jgi:hypothetical protein
MGFELDRSGVGNLCPGALSAGEVARPRHRDWEARNPGGGLHVDWIWICLLARRERWWQATTAKSSVIWPRSMSSTTASRSPSRCTTDPKTRYEYYTIFSSYTNQLANMFSGSLG